MSQLCSTVMCRNLIKILLSFVKYVSLSFSVFVFDCSYPSVMVKRLSYYFIAEPRPSEDPHNGVLCGRKCVQNAGRPCQHVRTTWRRISCILTRHQYVVFSYYICIAVPFLVTSLFYLYTNQNGAALGDVWLLPQRSPPPPPTAAAPDLDEVPWPLSL